jgi:membrane associated rhomboid family serine protease
MAAYASYTRVSTNLKQGEENMFKIYKITQNDSIVLRTTETPQPFEFAPKPKKPKQKFEFLPPKKFALPAAFILVTCALVTILTQFNLITDLSISWKALQSKQEWWRGFSALFAHSGIAHLASNALGILAFGWLLYGYFGKMAFPFLPVVFGVVTNYLTSFSYNENVKLVGISGMLYGMIGLWLILYMKFDTQRKFAVKLVRVIAFALILLVPTQYDEARSDLAHGIGFASGVLTGISYAPFAQIRKSLPGNSES